MTPELQAIAQRLEEVEKQIAHLGSLVVEQSDTDRDVLARGFGGRTVAAQTFILADAAGRPRAELSASDEGAAFCLLHSDGKPGVEISIRDCGPRIVFFDANGKRRATLETLSEPGGPWLGLFDENGNVRACLGTSSGGADGPNAPEEGPWLEFYDAKQKSVLSVTAHEHGPKIGFFYSNREPGVNLTLSEHGPAMFLSDESGKQRVRLAVDESGPCVLFGKDNKVFWSAPPTSAPEPMQPESNAKGDSASMSKSWIARAFQRTLEWVLSSSLKFFISFAFLAVPTLALLVVAGSFEGIAHDIFGIGKGAPDFVPNAFLAGIVISSLLCIGLRTGAFDGLFQKQK